MTAQMDECIEDPRVETIVLRGDGDRAFCAGGDIKFVHDLIQSNRVDELAKFWATEYRLDHLIATCPKPVVTVAHGLTLGGGMGLASHARHRIVTSSAQLGMPEILIGLSPDVGMLWRYGRAPGRSGEFATLCAARLSASDAVYMGLADVVVPEDATDDLDIQLQNTPAAEVLRRLVDAATPVAATSWVATHQEAIDSLFAGDVRTIHTALVHAMEGRDSSRREVAARALPGMEAASPIAIAVAIEALRRARRMADLAECFTQDLTLGLHFAAYPDLVEGIRARVVDKDRSPHWQPQRSTEVTSDDIARFFETPRSLANDVWASH